jgi:putative endonuclease
MKIKTLGNWAEQRALDILRQHGYVEVTKNFHSRYGEIDVIVADAESLIFVEVKARAYRAQVSAVESIGIAKQKKLMKTALVFLQKFPQYHQFYCRFDVMGFDFQEQFSKNSVDLLTNAHYELQWIENAFTFDVEFINL